jgi:2-polyprenyl-6-hydroxyphenyl methylase/3-demethylubiquinone-9 3-methyltransferase
MKSPPPAIGPDTVDPEEIAKFAAMAEAWWDPDGKFRPLHRFNPVRLQFIRDRAAIRFGRDIRADRPFAGLKLVDIGCGGGLLSEPLTRLGFEVTGVDATTENIKTAGIHARASGLVIDYRHGTAEGLAATGARYDMVLAMEVIEHVADVPAFLTALSTLLRPDGLMIIATLNRTPKAFAFAILGAEYVLRWLPRGTHEWRKFLRPSELAAGLRRNGIRITEMTGTTYRPLTGSWSLSPDLDVNYMVVAETVR